MLYHLFKYFDELPGSNMVTYVSFRALVVLMISLVLSLWLSKKFITYMKRKRHIEQARDESIDPYGVKKKGVPSMGGVVIIFSILIPILLFAPLDNIYIILLIVTLLWFGALGFIDDYKKLKGDKDGMKPRYKLLGQFALGALVGIVLFASPETKISEKVKKEKVGEKIEYVKSEEMKSTVTTVPFFKDNNFDYLHAFTWMGNNKTSRACGWILFILVTTFVIMAVSNGANLNDGMDGMCAGNSAIIGTALGILAYVSGHLQYAAYFNVMYIPHSGEIVVFICAFVGALIGFLWFNAFPAKVFMGDTGSLAIGGIIAVTAVIIHKELLLPILCGIFLVESLSVMIQVTYAKRGNKLGQKWRVFKRTPIHDHFRVIQSDMLPDAKYIIKRPGTALHENMITIRFWIITILLAAITIVTLKIR